MSYEGAYSSSPRTRFHYRLSEINITLFSNANDLRGRSGFLEIVFVGECEVLVCL